MLSLLLALALNTAQAAALAPEVAQTIWLIELQRLPPATLATFLDSEDPAVRERATLALGRLRSPDALPALEARMADPDPKVRRAAAFGFGLTPGGAVPAAAHLATEADVETRAQLLAALGDHTRPEDLPLLIEALDGPPQESREAAVALSRYGVASMEIARTDAVAEALTRQLKRLDPDARRGAAFALARLSFVTLPAEVDAELRRRMKGDHDPNVRAWLVRALSSCTTEDKAKATLLDQSSRDIDAGVRTASARAFSKLGSVSTREVLVRLLADKDPGVRLESIGAATVLGFDAHKLLDPLVTHQNPEVRAAAVSALAIADPAFSLRPYLTEDQPLAVRMAAISGLDDPDQLVRLATRSAEAPVRSAAAGRLVDLDAGSEQALALLGASDAKIVSVGASIVAKHPDPKLLAPLLSAAEKSEDTDVLIESLKAITAVIQMLPPKTMPPPELTSFVNRALVHPQAPVREAAMPAAKHMGLNIPTPVHMPPLMPQLDEVMTIASARILTDAGEIRVELWPEIAPYTVWNFARLADEDYFDGLSFHRVVPDFVIQDGCPRGDGWGGPGYAIPDELNWMPYDEGTLGMALSGPDTGGSQWFLTLSPQPHLDAHYTAFGKLIYGRQTMTAVQRGTVIQDVIIERVPVSTAQR